MKGIIINRLLAAVLVALLIAVLLPAPQAGAAVKPGMLFDCEYSGDAQTLTVTAYLTNPDDEINSGMFVLEYDKSLLSTDTSKIKPCSGITIPETNKYLDSSKGYAGADWYPNSTIAKSSSQKSIATVTFNVAEGKTKSDLEAANAVAVCDDEEYLESIGGYGDDGGLLLCKDSMTTFDIKDSKSTATVRYSTASGPAQTEPAAKPKIHFDGVLSADGKTLTVTASVSNPVSKTGAAMFALEYDPTKLSINEDKIVYLGDAKKSKTYCTTGSSGTQYVGADWYYDTALPASSTETPAVRMVFSVKDGTTLDAIKNSLSVCDDDSYLSGINYKDDGGILICETGSKFYNAKNSTANSEFTYKQDSANNPHPIIHFHSVYTKDTKKLTVTAYVKNPDNPVSSAMFVLKYDSSKLSITKDKVTFLGSAIQSKVYCSEGSSGASPSNDIPSGSSITSSNEKFVGADWYYDTPLPASSTETAAVKMVFDVKNNPSLNDLKSALAVCDNEAYLKSLTYGDDGGLLVCEDGDTFYNAKQSTASATFTWEESGETVTTTTTTTYSDPPPTSTTPKSTPPTTPSQPAVPSGDPAQGSYPFLVYALIISAFVALVSGGSILYFKLKAQ